VREGQFKQRRLAGGIHVRLRYERERDTVRKRRIRNRRARQMRLRRTKLETQHRLGGRRS
jgi:hypothetical protein